MAHKWKRTLRKDMNKAEDAFRAIGVDSLLNFETVKYYNAEEYETDRYRAALLKSQHTDWLWTASYHYIHAVEKVITRGGLLAGALLCAFLISKEEDGLTVGDYVLFASYTQKLISPLNYLQYMFKYIQKASVDIEKMFDIMDEKPEVFDRPEAVDFHCRAGKIEFKNVSFSFKPGRPVLSNLNFVVEPGKTLAIVGPTGAGKSTVIRLLFRFYDVMAGEILFDNQNITTVKQRSLRRYIGVVPQDTVLFNDSIRFNIRYGRIDATDDEVDAAAKAADVHDAILGFAEGYDTKVGERGLKLSGGEKQRIAIARTILKAPKFVFLDEATSALDTNTERNIQASLQQVCAGRTTVVIAHRLSTVIAADEILVLRKGSIVERGKHKDLLEQKGLYHNMWMQQLTPDKHEASDSGNE
uniref:Uncharacterized protein n=1 Tax=Plectus sambesii TaxID=2011161 RepID=A0A914XI34_9BILA